MSTDLISRDEALRAVGLCRSANVGVIGVEPVRIYLDDVLAALRSLPAVEHPVAKPAPAIDDEHQAWLAHEAGLDAEPCDECGEFFDPCELHAIGGDSVCAACARSLCPDEFGEEESDEG